MAHDDHKKSDGGIFPPDLAAVLAPTLLSIVVLYVSCGIEWAKNFGDRSLLHIALCLGGAGSLLLLAARLPLYRQHRFFTFGPRSLTGIHRKLYYAAYCLILPSVALLALLLLNLR